MTNHQTYTLAPSEVVIVERDDDDLGYLWFADRQSGDSRYFTVTRSFRDGSIHLERDDQQWQSYGGLTSIELGGGLLTLHFDKSAAAALGGIESAVVDCQAIEPALLARLEHALAPLVAGTNVALQVDRA
jgi:hypothetical protein